MAKSSTPRPARKPEKPSDDFPLTPRHDGRWAKKIYGKVVLFKGTADEALAAYREHMDKLGGNPPDERLQIYNLLEAFMCSKEVDLHAGQLTDRSFREYHLACDEVLAQFGRSRPLEELNRADAEALRARLTKGVAVTTQRGRIVRTRSIFLFAFDQEMMARPFHKWIKQVPKGAIKSHAAKQPPRLMTCEEIRQMVAAAAAPLKAMILLGVNAGYGNSDCSNVELQWLDLDAGWSTFPRFKTGEHRKAKLWPITVQAIREAIASRPEAKDATHARRLFLTRCGTLWVKPHRNDCAVSKEFRKLAIKLGIHRPGLSFYSLRHCFETVGGGCRDQVAVNAVMGHVDQSMAANYRHGIENERFVEVAEHVHRWLFGKPMSEGGQGLRVVG